MSCYSLSGGSLFLFDRKVLRYFRKDGHNWRKKKDGKTVKEAHERLKVRKNYLFTAFGRHHSFLSSNKMEYEYCIAMNAVPLFNLFPWLKGIVFIEFFFSTFSNHIFLLNFEVIM